MTFMIRSPSEIYYPLSSTPNRFRSIEDTASGNIAHSIENSVSNWVREYGSKYTLPTIKILVLLLYLRDVLIERGEPFNDPERLRGLTLRSLYEPYGYDPVVRVDGYQIGEFVTQPIRKIDRWLLEQATNKLRAFVTQFKLKHGVAPMALLRLDYMEEILRQRGDK